VDSGETARGCINSEPDKIALRKDHFLAAFIDFSKAYDRVCR